MFFFAVQLHVSWSYIWCLQYLSGVQKVVKMHKRVCPTFELVVYSQINLWDYLLHKG